MAEEDLAPPVVDEPDYPPVYRGRSRFVIGGTDRYAREQRAQQRSAYAAARFDEWSRLAPIRERSAQVQLRNQESQLAKREYDMYKEDQILKERAAFFRGLPILENQLNKMGYKIGTQQYADEFATYVAGFPWASQSADISDIIKTHAKVNDTQAQLDTALGALRNANLQKGEKVSFNQGGLTVSRNEGKLPNDIVERYGRLSANLQMHEQQAATEEAENRAANKPGVPYSESAKMGADAFEKQYLEQNFPDLVAGKSQPQQTPVATPAVTPQVQNTGAAATQLQAGATREVGGVTYTWDGTRWGRQ